MLFCAALAIASAHLRGNDSNDSNGCTQVGDSCCDADAAHQHQMWCSGQDIDNIICNTSAKTCIPCGQPGNICCNPYGNDYSGAWSCFCGFCDSAKFTKCDQSTASCSRPGTCGKVGETCCDRNWCEQSADNVSVVCAHGICRKCGLEGNPCCGAEGQCDGELSCRKLDNTCQKPGSCARDCKGKCHLKFRDWVCRGKTDDTDDCTTGFRPEYQEVCHHTSECQHSDDTCCNAHGPCSDCCALKGHIDCKCVSDN